jgi:hypothetical protein
MKMFTPYRSVEQWFKPRVRVPPGTSEDILGGNAKTSCINRNERQEPLEP